MKLSQLGSRIKAERRLQGMTLEVLAERLGISRNFLWEIEAGREAPALKTFYRLSAVLNVSADYLLGISDEHKRVEEHVSTERNLKMEKIFEQLSRYGDRELLMISNMLDEFEKYRLFNAQKDGRDVL